MVTNDWKHAFISPLFKGKSALDQLDNYRGISILQVIVKLFKQVLWRQITTHFDRNCSFACKHHCFRTYHSCETALRSIIINWKVSISHNKVNLALFIDLRRFWPHIFSTFVFKVISLFSETSNRLLKLMFITNNGIVRPSSLEIDGFNVDNLSFLKSKSIIIHTSSIKFVSSRH